MLVICFIFNFFVVGLGLFGSVVLELLFCLGETLVDLVELVSEDFDFDEQFELIEEEEFDFLIV